MTENDVAWAFFYLCDMPSHDDVVEEEEEIRRKVVVRVSCCRGKVQMVDSVDGVISLAREPA